ncbi:17524_t:CDS:1, partial [Acaulospora morrowiae]
SGGVSPWLAILLPTSVPSIALPLGDAQIQKSSGLGLGNGI